MDLLILNSLQKVFSDEKPKASDVTIISMLKNERTSFQVAFCPEKDGKITVSLGGDLSEVSKVFLVKDIPVGNACFDDADDFYLRKSSGMYPDYLLPVNVEIEVENYYEKSVSFSGLGTFSVSATFYTEGEAGGFIGFMCNTASTITNCHTSNVTMKCFGQDNQTKYIQGKLLGFIPIVYPYNIAGRHVNHFIGDIRTINGEAYVIDWSHATQGNASADAARTFLLFSMQGKTELAEKYLNLFAKRSGINKALIQRWVPIVAATQMTKGKPEEQEFLSKWIDVIDFE